jgi:hypothetical protein
MPHVRCLCISCNNSCFSTPSHSQDGVRGPGQAYGREPPRLGRVCTEAALCTNRLPALDLPRALCLGNSRYPLVCNLVFFTLLLATDGDNFASFLEPLCLRHWPRRAPVQKSGGQPGVHACVSHLRQAAENSQVHAGLSVMQYVFKPRPSSFVMR